MTPRRSVPDTSRSQGTVVLLCRDLRSSSSGLDVRAVAQRLAVRDPSIAVHILPDLCAHPDQGTPHLANHTTTLVVGLCRRPASPAPWQTVMRRAGLDQLGMEIVTLGVHAAAPDPALATEKAAILLTGAVAKVKAFAGGRPQHLRPVLPSTISRRSIFTLSLLEYQTVPAVEAERCRADDGCALCVLACPHQALQVIDGEVRMEKPRCTGCGVCVTACPHDAMELPGYTPAEMEARMAALLDPSLGELQPRAILFVCSGNTALDELARRGHAIPAPWLPVEVPCVEMVSSGWQLACLARGAAAVGIVPCPDPDRAGPPGRLEGRMAFCRLVLAGLGEAEERIFLLPAAEDGLLLALHRALPSARRAPHVSHGLFSNNASAQVVREVARTFGEVAHTYGEVDLTVAHPHSPFGVVEVGDECTICGACADVCPTEALEVQHDDGAVLKFDAANCVGCGLCLPACPEPGVLRLRQATDLRSLAAGRVGLRRTAYRRCRACGQPVAPEAMLARIAARLGSEYGNVEALIANYCQDCRSSAAHFGPS